MKNQAPIRIKKIGDIKKNPKNSRHKYQDFQKNRRYLNTWQPLNVITYNVISLIIPTQSLTKKSNNFDLKMYLKKFLTNNNY